MLWQSRKVLPAILCGLLCSHPALAQPAKNRHTQTADGFRYVRPFAFGVWAQAGLGLAAKTRTTEGGHRTTARPELFFSGGANYFLNATARLAVSTGVHLNVLKTGYALRLSAADLSGISGYPNGTLLEVKDVCYKVSVPLWINWRTADRGNRIWNLSAGLNLNHAGFNSAFGTGYTIVDAGGRSYKVMDATTDGGNRGSLWTSARLAVGKIIRVRNGNEWEVGVFGEYSGTEFWKTTYRIDIPNQPVTRGEIALTGSGVGLSLHYRFAKPSKRVRLIENRPTPNRAN